MSARGAGIAIMPRWYQVLMHVLFFAVLLYFARQILSWGDTIAVMMIGASSPIRPVAATLIAGFAAWIAQMIFSAFAIIFYRWVS
jgi:hypothetical protein